MEEFELTEQEILEAAELFEEELEDSGSGEPGL